MSREGGGGEGGRGGDQTREAWYKIRGEGAATDEETIPKFNVKIMFASRVSAKFIRKTCQQKS